jgi:hypothetical protein
MKIFGVPFEYLASSLTLALALTVGVVFLISVRRRSGRAIWVAAIAIGLLTVNYGWILPWQIWGFPWNQLSALTGTPLQTLLDINNSLLYATRTVCHGLLVWAIVVDRGPGAKQ